jgi:hypothetical protein
MEVFGLGQFSPPYPDRITPSKPHQQQLLRVRANIEDMFATLEVDQIHY